MNVRFDTTVLSKESTCSCGRCDSALCFAIRNADIICTCNPCPSEKETNFTDIYDNVPANDVILSNGHETVLKDELDKYDELKTEFTSKNQLKDSTKKTFTMKNNASPISVGRFIDDDQYFDQLHNSTPNRIKSNIDSISSQLASQISNFQCNDNNNRTTNKKSVLKTITLKYPNDILKKIRDVYMAVSSKVCESIYGKSTMNKDFCDCKPCDCNKCKSTFQKEPSEEHVDDESYPCVRCDRKEECIKISSDKKKSAYPKTCDATYQKRYNYETPCDCKPCQCIDCLMSTEKFTRRPAAFVVAQMQQGFVACDCAPCECSECVQSYRILRDATTRHEMSTRVNRHPRCQCETCVAEACVPDGNDSCWCVRQHKIMSKPLQNSDEYDIRRAEFSSQFRKPDVTNGLNTVAMLANTNNIIPPKAVQPKEYACGLSKCIFHPKKENTESVIVPERDCESNRKKHYPNEQWSSKFKKCACDTCKYIDCESREPDRAAPIVGMHTNNFNSIYSCKNSTIKECHSSKQENQQSVENRENLNISVAHRPVYIFQNTVHSSIKRQHKVGNSKGISLNTLVADCETAKPHGIHVHKSALECIDRKNIQLQEADTQRVSKVHNVTNNKDKRSTEGDTANDPLTVSHESLIKYSERILRNEKNVDTYLNSSGHDCAGYSILFPKTNVDEYINDFMKSNLKCRFSKNVDNDKLLHITTRDSNVKSILNESTNSSFNLKHVKENASSKKIFETDKISFKALCREEIIKNIKKKNSQQEQIDDRSMIDYYRQTKCSITAQLSENYRKIQDTLNEARKFSQDLVKLLQKCEQAKNKTIKYDTYKNQFNTNIDLLACMVRDKNIAGDINRGIKTKTCIHPSNNMHEKERCEYVPTENIKEPENKNINNEINFYETYPTDNIKEPENKNINNEINFYETYPTENIKEPENKNINNEMNFYETYPEMFTDPFYNYKFLSNEINRIGLDDKENNFKESFADKERTRESKDVKYSNIELKENQAEKKKNTEYKYLYKQIETFSEEMKIFPKYPDFKHDASLVTEEPNPQQDQTVTNKEEIHVCESIIYLSNGTILNLQAPKKQKSSIVVMKTSENNDTAETSKTESTITKQNSYPKAELNIRSKQNVIPILPNLEMEIKDAIRLFASKPKEDSALTVTSSILEENASLIQSEAKKLMDSKVFQPFIGQIHNTKDIKEHVESNVKDAKSTPKDKKKREQKLLYHSCSRHRMMPSHKHYDLQVSYVCIRKVSDHTVFVKWNAPEDIDRVQGYEILVDGRLVHKTDNPTKCLAVITCLSSTKKVLVTVRTVPNVPDVQRMLSTTIVYRPKKNK